MTTEEIYNTLRTRLMEGAYKAGSRFPSEDTLTQEFNVSKVTINKIVSRLVSMELLVRGVRGAGTRVAEAVLRPKGCIAFVGRVNPYSMKVLEGVQKECLHQNYFPVVFSPEVEEMPYCLSLLNCHNVKGLITMGYGVLTLEEGLVQVCLDYNLPHHGHSHHVHFISSDNYAGGRMIMQEVLRRGHRQIAVFSAERFALGLDAPIAPRVEGFLDVLKEAGYGDASERCFYGLPSSVQDARSCLKGMLEKYPGVSMICADSDHSAELIHHVAREMGISCPGDIGLTGFGHVTHLEIGTVDQQPGRQGQLAVRHICAVIENKATADAGEELVTTELANVEKIPIRLGEG